MINPDRALSCGPSQLCTGEMVAEIDLVKLSVFLAASYAGGEIARLIRVSPILAYILIGALLGPPLANFVPIPDGVQLVGLLGVQLSVIDAGLSTELGELKKAARRGIAVAVLGVLFPIAGSCLVVCLTDYVEGNFATGTTLKTAFAVGSAIAPTSLGVTARLLAEAGELDSKLGQLISIAAVFDDVISLVLLSQVLAVARPDPTPWILVQPVVFSVVFIVGALIVAVVLPVIVRALYRTLKIPEWLFERVGLWTLMITAGTMTYLATLAKTSFLLAGYLTGVAFAQLPSEKAFTPWNRHVGIYIEWLARLFFAGTIGFVIPIKDLFSASSLAIGALLACVSVFGKLLCGIGMLPDAVDGVAVAVAMLGRGEFGFLIASQARAAGLLSERLYAATIWGVVVPTLLTPIIFEPVFKWRRRRKGLGENMSEVTSESASEPISEHED